MIRPALLLPLLGLACQPALPEGLPPDLVADLTACQRLRGPPRDWCEAGVISDHESQIGSGAVLAQLCVRLREPAARDRCLMQSSRLTPPPPAAACDDIQNENMRASCLFDLADSSAREAATMEELVAICDSITVHRDQCYAHFVQRSQDLWCKGGDSMRLQLVDSLLRLVPDLPAMAPVGTAMAEADVRCASSGVTLCGRLTPGPAADACADFLPKEGGGP